MSQPTNAHTETAEALVERIRDNDYDGYTLNIDAATDAIAHALAAEAERATLAEREACAELACSVRVYRAWREQENVETTSECMAASTMGHVVARAIRARKEADRGK